MQWLIPTERSFVMVRTGGTEHGEVHYGTVHKIREVGGREAREGNARSLLLHIMRSLRSHCACDLMNWRRG